MRRGSRDGQAGVVSIWMLVLAVALLAVGGLSVDLWRVLADRRELTAMADAAAYAAAGRIDEAHYRATGEVVLHPPTARAAAAAILAAGTVEFDRVDVVVGSDRALVFLRRHTDTLLLRLLDPDLTALEIEVTAEAVPRLLPG